MKILHRETRGENPVKRIDIGITDPKTLAAVREEAKSEGVSEEEIVVRALRFWLVEKEMDEEEADEKETRGI